ncbi:INTEGRIN-LINKED KINASE1 [Hibiscus trionum]|uniref:non-specific serine/threonine protein kinase n=1 Tax=Hibiscus trionum TaxID=183268 RepID=A0A9W7IIQ3_HIBTR|nr:INTEGRIN-LINKED KINASE1 [Hibiscus trionum]
MENTTVQLQRQLTRQLSTGSLRRGFSRQISRQSSMDPRRKSQRFSFGRQSSMDPIHRTPSVEGLTVPGNLDSTMQLLFKACRGDVEGLEELLDEGVDVDSIDLDGRTALHIAACEGHVEVVELLLSRDANIDARDHWGSTAAADAKYYGNLDVYNLLKARGASIPKTRKTPMTVSNPGEVPEYELNPTELQIRRSDGIKTGSYQVAKWNGTKVSVKILDKNSYQDPETINAFKHELTLLEKVRHPNLVQFVGAVTQNIPMMIVSEYHPNGDLGSYLHKKGRLSPHKALNFALDIARGMNYLHEHKPDPIIHCDLRPKNVLMDSGGQLKVAGFGLLRLSNISYDKAKLAEAHIDPSNIYMAPEVYKNLIVDRSVDAYSFGVMLYEMIEGSTPFHSMPAAEAVKLMCLEGKRPSFKTRLRSYPPDLRELIEECWNPEPLVRPIFSEIIVRLDRIVASCSKHGWLKDTFKLHWYACLLLQASLT